MKYLSQSESQNIDSELLKLGFNLPSLIEIAGFLSYEAIISIITTQKNNILVIIGPGNNGADGLVISRWLKLAGHEITILVNKTPHKNLLNICTGIGITVIKSVNELKTYNFIIDAIFGFSFKPRPICSPYLEYFDFMAKHGNVISVDVPSGYEIDKISINPKFVPIFVVCLVGPKICCKDLNVIVTRAFCPGNIFYDVDYTNFNMPIKLF